MATAKKDDDRFWNIPVYPFLDDGVEKLVKDGKFSTKADAIRTIIRGYLERRGLIE